jgi:alpha-ketoglutarate-dependent taurine dioxygenase
VAFPVCDLLDTMVAVVRQPEVPDVREPADVAPWLADSGAELTALLRRHGAVLMRGFPIRDAGDFAGVTAALAGDLRPYVDGNSPRTAVSAGVYTSTDYPPAYLITLHNELSYASRWPERLFFFCEHPADEGGETLLAPGTVPLAALDAAVLERFRAAGVAYVRNLHGGRGMGRSWPDTFETGDRAAVEAYLAGDGAEFRWTADGGLRITQRRPALRRHPDTDAEVWFSQADQWHSSALDPATRTALLSVVAEADLPLNAFFGDGQPLDPQDLRTVREALLDAAVGVRWERGDLLVVDNMRLLHGRSPYRGPRRVLVGMS